MRDTDEPPARASDMSRPAAAPHGRQKVLVVEVVDTGSGVSEQARKRLFTQFCQGAEDEVGVPRACSGTGLGLSICARQVRPSLLCLPMAELPQALSSWQHSCKLPA